MNNSDSNQELYDHTEDALMTLAMRKMIQIYNPRQLPEKKSPIDSNEAESLVLTTKALAAAIKARHLSAGGEDRPQQKSKVDEMLTNFTRDIDTILSENDVID